ncbi:alpha/beta hydrolase [Lactiplantibacillus garii]|uniref:Alpha/beta hydrolase n=1 Tax=Lactiplantibacillus garii TaxID=2306423 RepID=A0A426D4F0_9LACO|nr:alpha/beta hydrolase [Lactiplantibacillus garii]RRK09438.1 alpha/beta hydrolase [Lactiplantibacillus garii]
MPKKVMWGLIACGTFLLLIIGLGLATQLKSDRSSHVITQQKRPLIMIAGSNSTPNNFDDIIKALNAQHRHPVINVTVTANQTIQFKENRVENTHLNDALIVIYFKNSADTNANIVTQTNGLAKAMAYLKKRVHLKTANALGYSNGGLIWSRYVAGLATTKPVPIHDLMLIGTPFLGTDERQPDHDLYDPLLKRKDHFKSLHAVVNVAGDTSKGDDNVVPLSSVTAGGKLFMNTAGRYTQMTVNVKNISHGNLLQERYVARLVRQNLVNQ